MTNGLPLFQALFCLKKQNNNNNQIHPVDLLQRYQCTMKFWYRHIIVSKSERGKKNNPHTAINQAELRQNWLTVVMITPNAKCSESPFG